MKSGTWKPSDIDFAGGIGVLNTGHRHPKVMAAVAAQLKRFTHTCFQVMPYPGYVELAEKLNHLTPGKFPKKTSFFSTGAEAIENAVKIARAATGRSGIIAFSGAFHGRTMMAMALRANHALQAGFGPFPPRSITCPSDRAARRQRCGIVGGDRPALQVRHRGQARCSVIIEPGKAKGSMWLAGIRASTARVVRRTGMLLIADEVQSGFARTGKYFALEHYGVDPDIIVTAKSLAGGFPLSAVTGKAELMDAAAPGGLGGTYAGNPSRSRPRSR
jgi:4-aminobutyrate aminotransferase-like enzyme